MLRKTIIAAGAVMLLAIGGTMAEARDMGGGGGAHFSGGGGAHFGGGFRGGNMGGFRGGNMGAYRGGNFGGRTFRGGPSTFAPNRGFNGSRAMRPNRNFTHNGPGPGWNGGKPHGGHHHHHHHRRGIYIGSPYLYDYDYGYYDSGYYDDDCSWLYRRALRTGSPYWWSRYRACAY